MTVVEFRDIVKSFGPPTHYRALDGVSAKFESGKIHAILGENGAGKTSLMKVLFGLDIPTAGEVRLRDQTVQWRSPADAIRAGLGMVHQHFSLVESISVIDNIMLGFEKTDVFGRLKRSDAIRDLEAALPTKDLRLGWHRPVHTLAVGEKQRVEILKLIARNVEILVLDEPTAVLSPLEIESLFSVLKGLRAQGKTIFVITHKLAEVFNHCDTWTVLRAGKKTGEGQVASSSIQEVVRAMVGVEIPPLSERKGTSERQREENILKVRDISMRTDSAILSGISFGVNAGEILGIAGVDGSGQAELVDCLLGLSSFEGAIDILGESIPGVYHERSAAKRLFDLRMKGLALISEDRHEQGLWMEEDLAINTGIGFQNSSWIDRSEWVKDAKSRTSVYDVRYASLDMPVSRLSGGNQQKLIFSRELLGRKPKLIIAHQPTRGVDLAAVRLIHDRILQARNDGASVLVISSELDELFTLSDVLIVMSAGKITGRFGRSGAVGFDRTAVGSAMTSGSSTIRRGES